MSPLKAAQLISEKAKCVQVSKSQLLQQSSLRITKKWEHRVHQQAGQICISKEQLPVCVQGSFVRAEEKNGVQYVCMNNSSEAMASQAKALAGKKMPELLTKKTSFEAEIVVPPICAIV